MSLFSSLTLPASQGNTFLISSSFSGLNQIIESLASYAGGYTGDGIDDVQIKFIPDFFTSLGYDKLDYSSNDQVFFLVSNLEVTYSGDSHLSELLDYSLIADVMPISKIKDLESNYSFSLNSSGLISIKSDFFNLNIPLTNLSSVSEILVPKEYLSLISLSDNVFISAFSFNNKWEVSIGQLDDSNCFLVKS